MSVLNELVEKLEVSLNLVKEEIIAFEKGRKNAAGKIRKEAQVSKNLWQTIRVETMNALKAMPTKTREPKA